MRRPEGSQGARGEEAREEEARGSGSRDLRGAGRCTPEQGAGEKGRPVDGRGRRPQEFRLEPPRRTEDPALGGGGNPWRSLS